MNHAKKHAHVQLPDESSLSTANESIASSSSSLGVWSNEDHLHPNAHRRHTLTFQDFARRATLTPQENEQINAILHTLTAEEDENEIDSTGHHRDSRHRKTMINTVTTLLHTKVHPKKSTVEPEIKNVSESLWSIQTKSGGKKKLRKKLGEMLQKIKNTIGVSELMRELRIKREEYEHQVEDILNKKKSHEFKVDHPYVALRKRIEAMSRNDIREYSIRYTPFLIKTNYTDTKIPIHATAAASQYKWLRCHFKRWKCKNPCLRMKPKKGFEAWKLKRRWVNRRGGVTTIRNRHKISLMDDVKLQEKEDAEKVYDAHVELRDELRELFTVTRAKANWKNAFNKITSKHRLRSMAEIVQHVLRRKEAKSIKNEAVLIKKIIRKCSLCDLTTGAEDTMYESRRKKKEREIIFLNKMLENISLSSNESFTSSDDDEDDDDDTLSEMQSTNSSFYNVAGDSSRSLSSSSEGSYSSVYKRIVGIPEKSPNENLLDITIRLKRDLDFPQNKEINLLRKLRQERYINEWEAVRKFDGSPAEHFITVKVIKQKNKSQYMVGLRVIVLPNYDHFVIKRLPFPRPIIVVTDESSLEKIPGADRNSKLYQLAMTKMKDSLGRMSVAQLTKPSNQISLMNNLNATLYNFIESDKTCVIIIEKDSQFRKRENKYRWLTPTLRRQKRIEELPSMHEFSFDVEEVTIAGLKARDIENERVRKLWDEPSDIIYHPPSFHETKRILPQPTKHEIHAGVRDPNRFPIPPILDENVMRKAFNINSPRVYDDDPSMNVNNVQNLTSKWERGNMDPSILVLHNNPTRTKSVGKITSPMMIPRIMVREVKFDVGTSIGQSVKKISDGISMQAVFSQGPERLLVSEGGRLSVNDIQALTKNTNSYSNLRNEDPNFWYYTDGKTLIIEKQDEDTIVQLSDASSSATRGSRRLKAEFLTGSRTSRMEGSLRRSKSGTRLKSRRQHYSKKSQTDK